MTVSANCSLYFNYQGAGRTLTDAGGYFTFLPTEILHKIMAVLDHKDLISLALTSHDISSYVRGYVVTDSGFYHTLGFMPSSTSDSVSSQTHRMADISGNTH